MSRSSPICTPTICTFPRWPGSIRARACSCPGAHHVRCRGCAGFTHLRLEEVAPGDERRVGDLLIRAVAARHDGRRLPVGPHRSPALGFVVEGSARTYFAGDTGLFDDMAKEVGPVDVALLPVGGWGPHLGEGHLDAGRAAQALAQLAPRSAVPVHYGTYWPIGLDAVRPHEFHAPGSEFVRLAAQVAPGVDVHRLEHGESMRLEVAP